MATSQKRRSKKDLHTFIKGTIQGMGTPLKQKKHQPKEGRIVGVEQPSYHQEIGLHYKLQGEEPRDSNTTAKVLTPKESI